MNVRYSPKSREDLSGIWAYIARDSLSAADKVIGEIKQTCRLIATQPGMGEACSQYRRGLRRFIVGNYIIFYLMRRQDNELEIVRVLHGARDIDSLF